MRSRGCSLTSRCHASASWAPGATSTAIRPRRGQRSAISRSASAGGITGSGAGTPGSCGSPCCGLSCRRRCRHAATTPSLPGAGWPSRSGPCARRRPSASTSARTARSGAGPDAPSRSRTGRRRRSDSRAASGVRTASAATARSIPPTSARTTPGASCSRRRHSAGRSRSWGNPPCRSRSPSTGRWRSWRSG
jgi:hypothetical protein